jgi:phosphoribosyl 1,2-cyclic phosphodiesterase
MLETGPYPWELKQRIRGSEGHLSNQQAGELLGTVAHGDLSLVVLAHMSEVNNEPEKAVQEASRVLKKCGNNGTRVVLSLQDAPVPMIDL